MKISVAESQRIAKRFTDLAGRPVNPSEVVEVLTHFDMDGAVTQEKANFRTMIWDRTSPINGVPAEQVLANRHDIPSADATIYLVYEGDRVLFFQPHDPDQEGHVKMTPAVAETKAGKQVEKIANERATLRMEQHLSREIGVDAEAGRRKRAMDAEMEARVEAEVRRREGQMRATLEREIAERETQMRASMEREFTQRILSEARER